MLKNRGGLINRYNALDGLRGICALLVCVMHARIKTSIYDLDFIRHSYLFVDFFFVLSGFVIASAYTNRVNSSDELKSFLVRRLGRIWPLHMLILFAFLSVELVKLALYVLGIGSESLPFSGRFSIDSLISNVFLIHSLGIHESLTWNNPSWSISTELFSYIVFGFSILLFKKYVKIFLVIALCALFTLNNVIVENMDLTYDYGVIRCLYGFSLGVLAYRVSLLIRRINLAYFIASLIEILSVILVVAFVSVYGGDKFSIVSPIIFFFSVLIFSKELGWISIILRSRFIQFLGLISFTMYMFHSLVLTIMLRLVDLIDRFSEVEFIVDWHGRGYKQLIYFGGVWSNILLLGYMVFVIVASKFIYEQFESPMRSKFSKFARARYGS